MDWRVQVEAALVDEPELLSFRGTFKLASEPRGVARSAALAAAEMVLVNHPPSPLPPSHVLLHASLAQWHLQ